ncbi:MAG: replicative DNA helicase [Dethiobacteria bacterium]
MIEERVPPQSIEAEQSVLGAMFLNRDAAFTALSMLEESDFYRSAHQKIFSAIQDLVNNGEPIDIITLSEELKSRGILTDIGGRAYLTTLVNIVPTAANVQYYAHIIREKAVLRRLINVATDIVSQSYEPPENVEEFLDKAEQSIFDVARNTSSQSFVHLKEILSETFDRIETLSEKKTGVTGVSTGFFEFDKLTAGLQNSELIIIAARPSMGKTTLALNIAQHIAMNEKEPVAFFSLEMSKDSLAQRLLCSQGNIDSQRMRSGHLKKDDWPKIANALSALSEADLFIDDSPQLSVMDIRAKARRLKAERGLKAIFIDYLQLMRSQSRSESRQQELSDISRSLKAMAKELETPVIALSQLSRAVEKRVDRRPILSDLMESGGIEANADLVVFIYREDYYVKDAEKKNIAEIIIAKQRNGPVGKFDLYFLENFIKFGNMAAEK